MPGLVWVTVASLAGGILVAMAVGGADSPWMLVALVAIVLVGIAITGARSFRHRRRIEREFLYVPPPPEPQRSGGGSRAVHELDGLLDERAIAWIGQEDFASLWSDDDVSPFREFVRTVDSPGLLTDPQMDIALERLAEATRLFLTTYEATTVADPLLLDDTWRMVRQTEAASGTPADDGSAAAARLRAGATRVVAAYSEVRSVTREVEQNR